ncbi:hypothetical protein IAR50_006775 [Cryptococcus sp. DSM 104548]
MDKDAKVRPTNPDSGDSSVSSPLHRPPPLPPGTYKTIFARPPSTDSILNRYHFTLTVPSFNRRLSRAATDKRYREWTARMWINESQLDRFGVPTRLVLESFFEGDRWTYVGDLNVVVEPFGERGMPDPDTWPSSMFENEEYVRFPDGVDGIQWREDEWIKQYVEKAQTRDMWGRRTSWVGTRRTKHGIAIGKKNRTQEEVDEDKWNEAISLAPDSQKRGPLLALSDTSPQYSKKSKPDPTPTFLPDDSRPLIQIPMPSLAVAKTKQSPLPARRAAPNRAFMSSPSPEPTSPQFELPILEKGESAELADAFLASFENELLGTSDRIQPVAASSPFKAIQEGKETPGSHRDERVHQPMGEIHTNVPFQPAFHQGTEARKLSSSYVPRNKPRTSGATSSMRQAAAGVPLDASSVLELLISSQAREVSFALSPDIYPKWLQDLQRCSAVRLQQRQTWIDMIEDLPDLRPAMEKQLQRVEKDVELLIKDTIRLA